MSEESIGRILELLDSMIDSIDVVLNRTSGIQQADDFLLSADKMFVLDGVCMK